MIIKRAYSELLSDAVSRVATNTEITGVNTQGSLSRAMLEVICGQLSQMYLDMEDNTNSVRISTAQGPDLDEIARLVGISRYLDEGDGPFRLRISQHRQKANTCTRTAIKDALIDKVENIRTVVFKDYLLGVGSYGVYITPVNGTISSDDLTAAQNIVDSYEGEGIRGVVLVPSYLVVSMRVKLRVSSRASSDVASRAREAIAEYISNLRMGEELIFNKIENAAFSVSSEIVDVQVERLLIDNKEVLHRNYRPEFDELFRAQTIEVLS